MLEHIRIVLVNPSHPGNIGSVARAMKTMGLSKLYLVEPKRFPHPTALELAAGADDVLQEAIVVSSLEQALADCRLAIGTSARTRGVPLEALEPAAAAQQLLDAAADVEVAVIFGREHAGLTNEELAMCHYHLHIPTSADYYSLNLAAAVQIVCYEIRQAFLAQQANQPTDNQQIYDTRATIAEIEGFYAHLQTTLQQIAFLDPNSPRRLMPRLKRLFQRTHLEQREIRILRGILTAVQKLT